MKCPRCVAEVEQRYACTKCGQVIGKKCLIPRCKGINPLDAQFCGDCGLPLSPSPRQWARYFGLYQRTVGHPRRNVIFFTTLATALLSIIVPWLVLGFIWGYPNLWPPSLLAVLGVFVFPPVIATYALWKTYPMRRGWLILAIFIAVSSEYAGLLIAIGIKVKLSTGH